MRPSLRATWNRIRSVHPAIVLATLDLIGLGIASYLSFVELTPGGTPVCTFGGVHIGNCEDVAHSVYSRPFAGIPVAVYGVFLSITLFALAIAWWRTGNYHLLLAHYGLSFIGVAFEGFLIGAVCIWCEAYGISLVLRFIVALWVYLHTPNPDATINENTI
jgi:uncharacterized membrane protein